MGERQLLKSVVALDSVKQQPGESLSNFYGRFHQNVTELDRRISDGEIIRAFYRGLDVANKASRKLRNSYHVKDIETLEELASRAKGFIDLERANIEANLLTTSLRVTHEPRRDGKKEVKKGKDSRPRAESNPAPRHPEVPEYFTPLNRQISAVLVEMERRSLARPPMPRRGGLPMGNDVESYCRYHKCKGHKTDDCKILKRDIERLIQGGMLKEFVAGRDRSRTPPRRHRSPAPADQAEPSGSKRRVNLIAGGFGAGGERSTPLRSLRQFSWGSVPT